MRSPAVRQVVRLRLTLVGPFPEIWREVVVDRDLTLADLRGIIHAVFEGQSCRHHLFTDILDSPGWSRTRHRWGDRWTMIDLRDPTVVDEATARIGHVLHDTRPLYYGHTCEGGWVVEIEAREDDLVGASDPPARLTGGERRTPLACSRGSYEHDVLVGVLADPDHPLRDELASRIEHAVGPWSHFDPEELDLTGAQRRLAAVAVGPTDTEHTARTGPGSWLVDRMPRAARTGLERHLAASAFELPTVVTTEEAHVLTREFGWVMSHAANGGIPMIDGEPIQDVVQAGMVALGCDEERMLRLVAVAKRGRLLYARSGRLHVKKQFAAAAADAGELWALLAQELVRNIAPFESGALFLLAIADGSLTDPTIGVRRSAEALALMRGRWGWRRTSADAWGRPDPYDDGWSHRARWPDERCERPCDCPSDGFGTWHDTVARAIRDAAADAAGDEAMPVAARFPGVAADELGLSPDWFEAPAPRPYAVATRTRRDEPADEAALLTEVAELVRLLAMFGLERGDDGTWVAPPTLREFARECLRCMSSSRRY